MKFKKILVSICTILCISSGMIVTASENANKLYDVQQAESTTLLSTYDNSLMNSSWPMFKHDPQHTGRSPYGPDGNWPVVKWTFWMEGMMFSSPAIDGDRVIYIGSASNDEKCIYAIFQNGTEKWRYKTGDHVQSSPAIAKDGTIYIGSNDGNLYALYPNGTQKWQVSLGNGWIKSSPTIDHNGIIYVASMNNNRLCALYPNGTIKWSYYTEDVILCSPALDNNNIIYIGSYDGYLYAVYPNGTLKWRYYAGGQKGIQSSPTIEHDGTIYFGSTSGYLYALHQNGTLKWMCSTGYIDDSSPTLGSDGTIYIGSTNGKIHSIYPNGTRKWTYQTDREILGSPAIDKNGIIYCGSMDGNLYALNPHGTLKWAFTTCGSIQSSPAIDQNGNIYIAAQDTSQPDFYSYLYVIKVIENNPPPTPNQPTGPTTGDINQEYTYTTNPVTDPDGNPVQYQFTWDDGTTSNWTDIPQASHSWTSRGDYNITVKARDNYSMESTYSEPLKVHISGPQLIIDAISGGFGITAVVKNIGEMDITTVDWTIAIDGGIILHPENRIITGTLSLPAGEQTMIRSGLILGIGGILLPTVQLTISVDDIQKTINPRLLLFIVSIRNQ